MRRLKTWLGLDEHSNYRASAIPGPWKCMNKPMTAALGVENPLLIRFWNAILHHHHDDVVWFMILFFHMARVCNPRVSNS